MPVTTVDWLALVFIAFTALLGLNKGFIASALSFAGIVVGAIAGPASPVAPPDPRLLRSPGVRRASPSVVRVLGTACGLRIAGSGWVAAPSLVVTAAHVVAGQKDTVVEPASSAAKFSATVVAF